MHLGKRSAQRLPVAFEQYVCRVFDTVVAYTAVATHPSASLHFAWTVNGLSAS